MEETASGSWRFVLEAAEGDGIHPAMAELALPDNFVFPDGGMMRFSYRLAGPPGAERTGPVSFEPYFRTANGNLFQVWPRQEAEEKWRHYTEMKENYTMAFYGRANLPWRFADNRPVALVFFFRPGKDAATVEVRQPRIVRIVAES